MNSPSLLDRYKGSLVGLACGDAVGTTVEFSARGSFSPMTDMVGGGPFRLRPGEWTDDTSMALCLAQSLLLKGGFDAKDQMERYWSWYATGYMSSTGRCFDIGVSTLEALERFNTLGDPFAGSTDPRTAGNGSLMRLCPVCLYFYPDTNLVQRFAVESSRTTHAAPEVLDCCRLLAHVLCAALNGRPAASLADGGEALVAEPKVNAIANGSFLKKARSEITGTGYSVASLEASLWCVANSGCFSEAVLLAANLGDDADTTAAITGQIAGALYGVDSIPQEWRGKLCKYDLILSLAARLGEAAGAA